MGKYLLILTMGLIILSGCSSNNNRSNDEQAMDKNNVHEVKQSVKEPNKNLSGGQVAKRLVELSSRTPDVRDATAVVLGDYAVVGLDLDKDLDHNRVGTIKYSVTQALKNDPYGANAVVTSDPDTVQRLKEMGKSIKAGHPVAGIANELADIVERVMPDLPQNAEKPSQNVKNPNQQQNVDKTPNKQQKPLPNQQKSPIKERNQKNVHDQKNELKQPQ